MNSPISQTQSFFTEHPTERAQEENPEILGLLTGFFRMQKIERKPFSTAHTKNPPDPPSRSPSHSPPTLRPPYFMETSPLRHDSSSQEHAQDLQSFFQSLNNSPRRKFRGRLKSLVKMLPQLLLISFLRLDLPMLHRQESSPSTHLRSPRRQPGVPAFITWHRWFLTSSWHTSRQEDLIWVWQKQPWFSDRETLLVEWVDPLGTIPKESLSFRYLPANIRLYGVPHCLRSANTIDKLIQAIGEKDDSVDISQAAMFRQNDYVFTRVTLDVTMKLVDSVIIN